MTVKTYEPRRHHTLEAWFLDGEPGSLEAAAEWCGGYVRSGMVVIPHPDGTLFASVQDVVVRYSDVRYSVIPGHVFYDLYDDVPA